MRSVLISIFILMTVLVSLSNADPDKPYSYVPADRGRSNQIQKGEVSILPDRFLREYDPVTFFFNRDRSKEEETVEAFAKKNIKLSPNHPGEFVWIDDKTLEFRPVIPWPPIESFDINYKNTNKKLVTLLTPPTYIKPSNRSSDLDEVSTVYLTFPYAVPIEKLKKLITFELTPLPGIDRSTSIFYSSSDYTVKAGEEGSNGEITYRFTFNNPVSLGYFVRTKVQLSDAPGLQDGSRVYSFSTKPVFKILKAGTHNSLVSIGKDGSNYTVDNAMDVTGYNEVVIAFSSALGNLSITEFKNLVSFSPSPKKVDYRIAHKQVIAKLEITPDRMYKVSVNPSKIKDAIGRVLKIEKSSSFYVYSRAEKEYINWTKTYGIMERYGPHHVPLSLRGIESIDLRIYKIDPVSKVFWPFPNGGVDVNESLLPPGPGEEPKDEYLIDYPLSKSQMEEHIKMLGSPHYSEVISVDKEGVETHKTLDLRNKIESFDGKDPAGSYLVGFRQLNGEPGRRYVKLQITDLCLSTVTSKYEVNFSVSSYKTGKPLSGANITLEGMGWNEGQRKNRFMQLASVITDNEGNAIIPQGDLYDSKHSKSLRRVIVSLKDDTLVLDATGDLSPEKFSNNHWYGHGSNWLNSLFERPNRETDSKNTAGFVCVERPVYRPEDTVHVKGYVRDIHLGLISVPKGGEGRISITGPSESWEYNVDMSNFGSFNMDFFEEERPTGVYNLSLQFSSNTQKYGYTTIASTSFRIDAYRVPKYEVKLHSKDIVSNDKPFTVKAVASYYAGGKVVDADVRWRINSYPYSWSLTKWSDYITSSDSRYSRHNRSSEGTSLDFNNKTDDNGTASATVQPTNLIGANPRKFIVEATVTDVDQQTVTDTRSILSLPAFILGVKTKRYIADGSSINASLAAIGIDEKPVADQKVHVVLKRMSWNSYLQESDFSRGEPKYITEEEITTIEERDVVTGATPTDLIFSNLEAGVYILDMISNDKLGRQQSLSVDLFIAGDKAVTWKKADQNVFETVPDKSAYIAGDRAEILLKSPFQNGAALACLEAPDGSIKYDWVNITKGVGTYSFNVTKDMIPKVPISFLLVRPRIAQARKISKSTVIDPGKPKTIANTTWITVNPDANIINVSLSHKKVADPGSPCEIEIALKDYQGKPVSGEVTLWLVDKAVLSLGKEGSINPLPNFIPSVSTNLVFHDSRNLAFGRLADFESPGGDEEMYEKEAEDLITVRKNFKTVPYFNPSIIVGKSGVKKVTVNLPDNLTQFAIRAIAVTAVDRFGFKKSEISVRLPVIVQPSLPRFLRIGDTFKAGGVARVVEGTGGAAQFSIKANGLALNGIEKKPWMDFTLPDKKAQPVYVPLKVLPSNYDENGNLMRDSIMVEMAVRKKNSGKGDAFRVSIPLLPDRSPITNTVIAKVTKDTSFIFNKIEDTPRPNTCSRYMLVSNELAVMKALTALRFLIQYPHQCTEQRVSRAYPGVAYQGMWDKFGIEQPDKKLERYINETLQYLEKVQTSEGLFGYWPNSSGSIQLTAYVVEFLSTVKKLHKEKPGKYEFNNTVYSRAVSALKRALRTDYSLFTSGYKYYERSAALMGLAFSGEANHAYTSELALFNEESSALSQARIYTAIHESGKTAFGTLLKGLEKKLWNHTVFIKKDDREVFNGMQTTNFRIGAQMHGREINDLSGIVRAFSRENSQEQKASQLTNKLIDLGGKDGWGDTYANGLALLALHDAVFYKDRKRQYAVVSYNANGKVEKLKTSEETGTLKKELDQNDKGEIKFVENRGDNDIYVMLQERYLPKSLGREVDAAQEGFAVKRQIIYVDDKNGLNKKVWIDSGGISFPVPLGAILEEHVQVTNRKNSHFVAITIPLAAGLEYLNPELKTAAENFTPSGKSSSGATYSAFYDDRIVYYFNNMSAGTYDFYFRVRATTEGSFTQPPAYAELMYQQDVYGYSPGAEIKVVGKEQ